MTVLAAVLGLATIAVLVRLYLVANLRDGDAAAARPARAFMVAGSAITALGLVLVAADPWDTADAAAILTLVGGSIVFLVGSLVWHRAVSGRVSRSRALAIGALVCFACIGFALPGVVLAALVFAVLLLLALVASGWFSPPSASVRE